MSFNKQYVKEVLYLIGDNSKKLPFLIFLVLLSSILDVLGIGLIIPFISIVIDPDLFSQSWLSVFLEKLGVVSNHDVVVFLGVALVLVFVIKAIGLILINKKILTFCFQQSTYLRTLLMKSYQNLLYTDYVERNSAEYIHNINLAASFAEGTLFSILRFISESIVGLVILIFMIWMSGPLMLLLIFLIAFLVYLYDRVFKSRIKEYGELVNKYSTRLLQGVHEAIEGLKEIRILNKEDYFYRIVRNNAEGYAEVGPKHVLISMAPRYFLEAIIVTNIALVIIFASSIQYDLQMILPTLAMFGVAAIRLLPLSTTVISGITMMRFGRNSVKLLYDDIKNIQKIENIPKRFDTNSQKSDFQALVLKDVVYSYPESTKPALNKITLEILSGESIGFIGASGSGKTTLIDVFLGLLNIQEGRLSLNGNDLVDCLATWRSQVAYLPQQIFIIDDTLRKNIALGVDDDEIDDEKVERALSQAFLSEVVAELPYGIRTRLGERGLRLSGGQRQRVALARAFYHGRSVLIMDESTSALDNETELEIISEIQKLKGKVTMIIIAHRLSTLVSCDRIYKLSNGEIVDQGSYEQVIG